MEATQDAASPSDPPQPATDPLAIEQPLQQPEPSSEPAPSDPVPENPTAPEPAEPPPGDPPTRNNQAEAESSLLVAPGPAGTPPAEPSSSEAVVTANSNAENVIQSSTAEPVLDPLASTSEPQQCQSTEPPKIPSPTLAPSAVEAVSTPQESKPLEPETAAVSSSESSGAVEQHQQVPEVDTSTIAQSSSSSDKPAPVAASTTPTVVTPSLPPPPPPPPSNAVEPTNEAPTSSNSGSGGSGSSTNSSSFIGSSGSSLRNAVTGDNSLKINGISDLSILDVTQGNDDEIEVKVEGGSLMHKVIKFSLLNGMQDSSKRLENSRLIMSGVSSANGEATLATTSSLSGRAVLGGGPLRQNDKAKEEGFKGGTLDSTTSSSSNSNNNNKTTPPACSSTRPASAEPSSSLNNSNSNSSDSTCSANNSVTSESKPNRTEEASSRLRHSVDSNASSSGGASGTDSAREESVSDTYSKSTSLDFREWPKTAAPASTSSGAGSTTVTAAASSAGSSDFTRTNKETDQQPPTSSATSSSSSVKQRSKAMYYAELPDFSKPIFTAPSLTGTTPTSTTTSRDASFAPSKSLSSLQMKTPDFSRMVSAVAGPQPSSSSNPASSSVSSAVAPVSTTTSRSHELQIANPDFSKSFAPKEHHPLPPSSSSSKSEERLQSYMNPSSFAEISKQRNYISDLQLKNPQPEASPAQPHPSIVKGPPSLSSTSATSSSSSSGLNSYRIEKPTNAPKSYPPTLYRQEAAAPVQLEEPKAHVIHKASPSSYPETARTWNPAAYPPQQARDERDRYSSQVPSSSGQKGPPPLTGDPPQGHAYPGYSPYPPSKSKEPTPPSVPPVSHPGGIIVNNVKTYYPEPHQPPQKSNEPEFRLEHKEKQLRQEGTIITLKTNDNRPPANSPSASTSSHYPPQPYHAQRPRSPSAERREAQMMASSQEILYRDFKLKQSYEMPPQSSSRVPPPSSRDCREEPRTRQVVEPLPRDRSPYDPYYRSGGSGVHPPAGTPPASKYYPQPEHHKQSVSPALSATPSPTPLHGQNRSPAPMVPGKPQPQPYPSASGPPSGLMHPPSNWPNQSRVIPSPHGSATSSPSSAPPSVSPNQFAHHKNSPSPVHPYGSPQPGPSHHSYKSPSPSSSSSSVPPNYGPSGTTSSTKFTQYYPSGNGDRVVSIEIDKETYKPGYKGLDFNMEQKFAELYQAHQLKEKKAAAASHPQPYPGGSGEYSRHGPPQHPQQAPPHHSTYKPAEPKHQEVYRDEYGRVRTSAGHHPSQAPSGAPPMVNSRYGGASQENLSQYSQQYYHQRMSAEGGELRKSEPHLYKSGSSRDPSPAQRYGSSESLSHPSSKQTGYPPAQPSGSKAPPHHPAYHPSAGGEPSPYSLPSKSSYPYERPPEKQQPSVISNAYGQDRASSGSSRAAAYPESRQHLPTEPYPPAGHHYKAAPPQMKHSSTQQPYPQHPNHHPAAGHPSVLSTNRDSRDPAWHYQQQQQQQQPHQPQQPPPQQQPGPSSAYNHDRRPAVRDERQNPVIQPPISKNIPVKVIATANTVTPAAPSSTTIAPATSTTKRESPLDLSVKTVKTKADSTACDDYAHSSRIREVVPKVNFNPNFKKHIPERPSSDNNRMPHHVQPQPQQPHPSHLSREPQPIPPHHSHLQQLHQQQHPAQAGPSKPPSAPAPVPHPEHHRQMPVISPAIPPGYDKKTDAYMSANYRAVGGPSEPPRDVRYLQDSRYPPGPGSRQSPPDQPYGIPPGSYPPSRLPPGMPYPPHQYPQHPGQPPAGVPPKPDPYYQSNAKQPASASSRSVYYPPHEIARSSKHPTGGLKSSDDRQADRRFVESMLKKETSPSAEVIADLQAGKFSTRLPTTLAPAKKRPAENIPKTSPTKVPRVEEPNLHRPYESNYRHQQPPYPGPAAPRDYYPVPIKHEPVSPQPAGVYYADKRPEPPSISRGVLTTAQTHPGPATALMSHSSVLQPNTQQNTRPSETSHPSVITSYHPNRPDLIRPRDESPQHPRQQPYERQPDDHHFFPKSEPFRVGHGDSKYFGSSLEKSSSRPADHSEPQQQQQPQPPSTIVMQSHIQYGGHQPLPPSSSQYAHQQYKRPETTIQSNSPRQEYYQNSPNHVSRPQSIVENHHQSRSYENLPRLISDAQPKPSPEHRPTPPHLHSSHESLNQPSPLASPQHRGADQSVISKLRTSLEQKERINQLRKQTSSEMSEEDSSNNKQPDSNAFPPSHFRSKGAMKAYTPIPAFDMPSNSSAPPPQLQPQQLPQAIHHGPSSRPSSPPVIKSEQQPEEVPAKDPTEHPPEVEGPSALDILDWGSACNEFVEQLQTGKKRGRRKRGIGSATKSKDIDQVVGLYDEEFLKDNLPGIASTALSEVPQEVLRSAAQETREFYSSSDEDKPLQLLKQQQQISSSAGERKEELLQQQQLHAAISYSTIERLSEKIARNMREKQRLEVEQRHEARLGRSSSSESESDTRRVMQRSKMRARKLRNRSSVPLKSSDVNTDEEDEEEEEQNQATDLRKRKRLDQTSSESETGNNVKKVSRCQSQEVKQENGTDLSSDEEDPKARTTGKKNATPEVKTENTKQQPAHSDSDSKDVKTKDSVDDKKNRKAADAHSSGNESEKSEKCTKKGSKKFMKQRTTSKSKAVEESSESEESSAVEEETMTRSKSKLEMEKRRSNSKVLRNDKIVENFVRERKKSENITPPKGKKGVANTKLEASKKRILDSESDSKSANVRKRTRKTSKLQTTSESESSEESDVETVKERLRSRKQKVSETSVPSSASKRGTSQDNKTPAKGADKKNVKPEPPKKRGRQPKKTSKDCASENTSQNFYPGWEKECYEFKRSLKVPHELITIGGRQYKHRISTSLPDLDSHHSDESETFSEIVKKINQKDAAAGGKKVKTKAAAKQGQKNSAVQVKEEEKKIEGNKKFTSIIEILHERMLRHVRQAKAKKSKSNNDKDQVKPKPEFELLPTPGAESEALFNRRKKSLFDTAILKSRTRTEQKVMQSKEIIREVFGGDEERPQSAPPLACIQELRNVTYDEMYNEMLSKSNNVATFLAEKKAQEERAAVASSSGLSGSAVKVKIEDLDDETQDSVLKDSERITEEGDTPSIVSERDLATPVSFKGKKKTYKSRRKGSSGFDYIRKKKKPVVNNGENNTPVVPKKKVTSVFENLESKDETHISKEIRSWVLNKGVGESVMHKAARLGYTDVIVYCLERLEMDPDMKDNAGYTPLHEACAKGHLDICNYLLQYGASHSETALSGIRPLHEAVENSFIEVVRLLLAFGADPMLATYAGQTPIQLAENNEMALFLENYLYDIQSMSSTKTGWRMDGPWKTHDPEESGCDIFTDIPGFSDDDQHNNSSLTERSSLSTSMTTVSSDTATSVYLPPPPPPPLPASQKKCDSNSNIMNFEVKVENEPPSIYDRKYKDCAVVLNDIQQLNGGTRGTGSYVNGQLQQLDVKRELIEDAVDRFENESEDDEFDFEYEEAERPLPPLYLLKDDAAGDKWVLMTDLCNFLKLKSKEAVMRQIQISTSNNSTNGASNTTSTTTNSSNTTSVAADTNRDLIKELKIEEFLARASCLQLLYAGEKLNINSNKVLLVKYNDSVRNLLQVQTFVAKI